MKKALSAANFKKLDKSDMLGLLLDFPAQCRAAIDIAKKAKIPFEKKVFSKVIFVGVGASAIGGDLARSYLYFDIRVPVVVYREYDLPACVDASSLVFISSYSGNTEETLNAYKQAKDKGSTVIVISSGGKALELAERDGVVFVRIPAGLPPRFSLGYMSIIPLCILSQLGLISDVTAQLNEAIGTLEELRDESLHPRIGQKDNVAKLLAAELYNKFAIIYSSSVHFDMTAVRFRAQIAENAKALASAFLFPEMNHNEIEGWQNPAKQFKGFVVVMLRDKGMHPRVAKRMDITREIIGKEAAAIEVWSRGEGLLSRIFSLIYIGDFASFYLAMLYGIDPTPVERISRIKDKLSRVAA